VPSGPGIGRIAPGHRIWLHVDGVRMFGPGVYELLGHVADAGSLQQAAKLMEMSYTKAWHMLRQTEQHLGLQLVERQAGGVAGGGSSLTPTGRELIERFTRFMAETDEAMGAAFERAFGDWLAPGPPED
jgi:molybdate transport repressor ModE-like protein